MGRLAGIVLVTAGLTGTALADDMKGTADEAQSMVAAAIAYYDDVGADAAFKTITEDPVPQFRDGDLYVFVVSSDGVSVAHAFQPALVGHSILGMVDANGVHLGQEIVDKATADGVWVDYLYADPDTGTEAPKSSWVVRHGDFIFGCGIYK